MKHPAISEMSLSLKMPAKARLTRWGLSCPQNRPTPVCTARSWACIRHAERFGLKTTGPKTGFHGFPAKMTGSDAL